MAKKSLPAWDSGVRFEDVFGPMKKDEEKKIVYIAEYVTFGQFISETGELTFSKTATKRFETYAAAAEAIKKISPKMKNWKIRTRSEKI